MLQFPPVPSFDGLHPLVIHFPIALLLVVPVFVLIGAVLAPPRGRAWHISGLALLLLGTVSAFVAIESGEAAAQLAERSPEINAVLERHSGLAETTAYTCAALTLAFAALIAVGRLTRQDQRRLVSTALPVAWLLAYSVAILLLVNTAHNGGRLVHELGVHAIVAGSSGGTPAARPERTD